MAYKFDLERAIERTMQKYGIERPTAAQWTFILNRVHVPGLFKNSKVINLDRLEILSNQYIYNCYLHNQYVTVYGFCKLANVSGETLYGWIRGKSRKDDLQARRIVQTLKEERAISIQGGLDDPRRCLGALGILRHEYAWTKEKIEDFADMHGLICTDSRAVSERYKAVLKA